MRPPGRQLHRRAGQPGQRPPCFTVRFARFFNHTYRVFFSAGVVLLLGAPHLVDRLVQRGDHVLPVERQRRVRQVCTDPGDERLAHVRTGVADPLRGSPVPGQVLRERDSRCAASTSRNAIASYLHARRQDMKIEQAPPTAPRHDTPDGPITGRTLVP